MKSNMRSAGIRKNHRRIEHQTRSDIQNNRERIFKQKEHHPILMMLKLSMVAAIFGNIKGFFNRYFRNPFAGAISSLDLRHDMTMGENQHRAAGANTLRSWFPNLGKMVSTIDGRPV